MENNMSEAIESTPTSVSPETASSTSDATESTEETAAEGTESEGQEAAVAGEQKPAKEAPKMTKKEIEKQLKKYKIKVDGQEFEESLDLNDEDAVKKHLQMSRAAQKRMQEATEMRKAAEDFIQLLKTNPRKVLADPNIGVDIKQFAKQIIEEEIENSKKSPEQLRIEELQKELEERKEAEKKEKDEFQKREFARLQAEEEKHLETAFTNTLEKANMPKTPYTITKMAEYMIFAAQNNIKLSPDDVAPLVKKQMKADIKALFNDSNDDILEELVGKDRLTKMRKKQIEKAKQSVQQTAAQVKPVSKEAPKKDDDKPKEKKSINDFFGRF